MCGIVGIFCRESVIDWSYFDLLFKDTELRGTDGFGIVICRNEKLLEYKTTKSYSEVSTEIESFIKTNVSLGDLVLAISRATPETEPSTSETNMQPIINNGCVVIHNGAISNRIHKELKEWSNDNKDVYEFKTDIDSESILASYFKHNKNVKDTCEYLSGGFASLMYDSVKDQLYIMNTHNPISHCYIRGYGYFMSSLQSSLNKLTNQLCSVDREGISMWENYYAHPLRGHRIKEVDLDSGFTKNIKFSPRYITNTWDSYESTKNDAELTLVACSGGLDSSLTLSLLKLSGYDNGDNKLVACHFKYGHRGQDAELYAIQNVCNSLNIELKVFDIEELMSSMDKTSMLMDKNAEIITGTSNGLKTLAAWTPCRNFQFLLWMTTYAETLVLQDNYKTVNMTGGMMQLTEEAVYPDNSTLFLSSFLNVCKYGTLIGDRIKPLYCLSNLMKSDQFALIKAFGLEEVYKNTISCDRPIIDENGIPRNCSHNEIPACGSGLLSYWASKMVGMDDMELRNFYDTNDGYEAHRPAHLDENKQLEKDILSIIDRIILPEDRLNELKNKLK